LPIQWRRKKRKYKTPANAIITSACRTLMMAKTKTADMCVNMWYPASTIKNEQRTSCDGGKKKRQRKRRENNAPVCSQTPPPRSDNQIVPNTHLAWPPVLLWLPLLKIMSGLFFTSGALSAAGSLLAHAPEEVHNLLGATRASFVARALLIVRISEAPALLQHAFPLLLLVQVITAHACRVGVGRCPLAELL
jgi:hypothetical protein